MCNSRENEHLCNTWLPTKHFYIFLVVFFFLWIKTLFPGHRPDHTGELLRGICCLISQRRVGEKVVQDFSPAPHIHASPKHWTKWFSFHTAPKYLLDFPASLPDSLLPQPLEGERTGLAASQELCLCLMLPQGPDKGRKDPFTGEREGQRVKQLAQNLNWVSSRAGV